MRTLLWGTGSSCRTGEYFAIGTAATLLLHHATLFLVLFYRHLGKVAFVGSVHYAKGTYVGVVMDLAAVGKNDGE